MSRSVRAKQVNDAAPMAEEGTENHVEDDGMMIEDDTEEIDKIQALGINAGDINKLKAAGIYSTGMVTKSTKRFLSNIKGLSEAKVDKIYEACKSCGGSVGFMSGTDALLKRKSVIKVTTGSKAFDELLGGGIESRSITEVFGEYRTGKTQLAHTLCVASQLPLEEGGGNGKVCYIDTEGTFRPERIPQIAERFNLDPQAVLDNISMCRVHTSEEQMNILFQVAALFMESQYRVLIVDSIIALFRVDYTGRGELSERQQKLNQMLSRLCKLAEEFNVAVFITNQVQADPGGMTFTVDPKKPVGGHILAHASTTRLYLRKGRGDTRVAKIYDSPSRPEAEAIYQITDSGIMDAQD